jgi:hypothetical protein
MLITVTNLTAGLLSIGFPIGRALAASGDPGDSVTLGVSPEDLLEGTDRGNPAFKTLNLLQQQGKILFTAVDDPNDRSVTREAASVGEAVHLKIPVGFALADAATLYEVPVGKRLQIEMMLWETTADWTGGAASAVGVSSDQAPYSTQGDLLGGAVGEVAADMQAADGVHQGTLGTSFSAAPASAFLDGGSILRWDRITSAYLTGAGFVHAIGRWVS